MKRINLFLTSLFFLPIYPASAADPIEKGIDIRLRPTRPVVQLADPIEIEIVTRNRGNSTHKAVGFQMAKSGLYPMITFVVTAPGGEEHHLRRRTKRLKFPRPSHRTIDPGKSDVERIDMGEWRSDSKSGPTIFSAPGTYKIYLRFAPNRGERIRTEYTSYRRQ